MNLKVITEITTEPITLAEVKAHLRLDSGSLADDITTYQSIYPASRNAGSVDGTGVNVLGKTVIVNLNAGTNAATGTLDVHIEESDDNITYTDWTGGAFTQVTTANDEAVYEKQYTGIKPYIRAVGVVANAACVYSVDVIVSSNTNIEDDLLNALITTAREYCETFTGRALATQTLELIMDDFPACEHIELPKSPIQSITSIKYKASNGTEYTWASTNYIINADVMPGLITPIYNGYFPVFTPYPTGAVRIRYIAGHSSEGTPIPKAIKQALLILVGHWYENRELVVEKKLNEIPFSVNNLLYPNKVFRW